MYTSTEPAATRVQRGYEWLKTEGPRYGLDVTKLDPKSLRVGDPGECPLAHASGDTYGLGMSMANRSGDTSWAVDHGFWQTAADSYQLPGANGRTIIDDAWYQLLTAGQAPVDQHKVLV